MNTPDAYWDAIFKKIRQSLSKTSTEFPSVSQVAYEKHDPFRVLIATVISLRTRDEVTLAASSRLFSEADTPQSMLNLDEQRIAELIYPAGFYRTKAKNIRKISQLLMTDHGGEVPADQKALLALPGVGIKTANLTLNLGFNIDAICVDTHVHRISNRMGWIQTKTPEESEKALQLVMPQRHWIPLNEALVLFGQQTCTPLSPKCSQCPFEETCPKEGVTKKR